MADGDSRRGDFPDGDLLYFVPGRCLDPGFDHHAASLPYESNLLHRATKRHQGDPMSRKDVRLSRVARCTLSEIHLTAVA
jgi:hypothetical protein